MSELFTKMDAYVMATAEGDQEKETCKYEDVKKTIDKCFDNFYEERQADKQAIEEMRTAFEMKDEAYKMASNVAKEALAIIVELKSKIADLEQKNLILKGSRDIAIAKINGLANSLRKS